MSDRPASSAVAAILAATPQPPERVEVVTMTGTYRHLRKPGTDRTYCQRQVGGTVVGDEWAHRPMHPRCELAGARDEIPAPSAEVAARQAAAARPAILRELADELEAREAPAEGKIWLIDARWLRNRADEIEETNRG